MTEKQRHALVAGNMAIQIPAVMKNAENLDSIRDHPIDQKVPGRLDAVFGNMVTTGGQMVGIDSGHKLLAVPGARTVGILADIGERLRDQNLVAIRRSGPKFSFAPLKYVLEIAPGGSRHRDEVTGQGLPHSEVV